MVKKPKAKKNKVVVGELDLDPDAWPKFEKLIRDAAAGRPPPKKRPASQKP